MMQRILNSTNLVAFVLAAATGMTLYFRVPFPEGNIFLRVMALRSPSGFEVLKYSYTYFCSRPRTFAVRTDGGVTLSSNMFSLQF
jgi:hypothetical protein